MIAHAAASAGILKHVKSKSLVQGKWHGRGNDGRELACLLGAMGPNVNKPSDCNGDLMPMWLAELTTVLFDGIAKSEIYPIAERYGRLVARWHVLTDADWNGLLTRFLVRVIDDAVEAARPVAAGQYGWPAVETACLQLRDAIKSGDRAAAWAAAHAADTAARAAARTAASDTAAASATAASAAAWAAAHAVAARTAADIAAYAADAARVARVVAHAAEVTSADAAVRAAADRYLRLFTFLLNQIEAAVETRE